MGSWVEVVGVLDLHVLCFLQHDVDVDREIAVEVPEESHHVVADLRHTIFQVAFSIEAAVAEDHDADVLVTCVVGA